MEKIFDIDLNLRDELNLPSKKLEQLPVSEILKKAFKDKGVTLSDGLAFVVQETIDVSWRIVDHCDEDVRSYVLRREGDTINVFKPTYSGLSDHLFDYRIFEYGSEDLWCTGLERYFLDERQQRKWDYFFRPSQYLIGYPHQSMLHDLFTQKAEKEKNLPGLKFLTGFWALLIVMSIISIPFLNVVSYIGIVFFLGLFAKYFVNLREKAGGLDLINERIQLLIDEISHLQNQVPQNIPSDKEIDRWYDEELNYLEQEAIDALNLDPETILELSEDLNPHGLKGLLIEDWGPLQPIINVGIGSISRTNWHAVMVGEDSKPRYGVYFLQFIFPTNDLISVYSCYYDFIKRDRKGLLTDEYFYRHVVSVGSRTEEYENSLNPDRKTEATMFRLTVSSSDSIVVALTDDAVIEDMNKRFKDIEKLKKERRRRAMAAQATGTGHQDHDPSDDEYYENIVRMAESELPATRAKRAIAFIRSELRAKARIAENV